MKLWTHDPSSWPDLTLSSWILMTGVECSVVITVVSPESRVVSPDHTVLHMTVTSLQYSNNTSMCSSVVSWWWSSNTGAGATDKTRSPRSLEHWSREGTVQDTGVTNQVVRSWVEWVRISRIITAEPASNWSINTQIHKMIHNTDQVSRSSLLWHF